MTARYYLDKPRHKKETAIYLIARVGNKNLKINTREKIHPKFWDKKKEKVKPSYPGNAELNEWLIKKKSEVLTLYRTSSIDGHNLELKVFQTSAKELFENTSTEESSGGGFQQVYNVFIEDSKHSKQPATIKTYKTLQNHIRGYEAYEGKQLSLTEVDNAFKEKFHNYLIIQAQLTPTSIQKNFQILKRFMRFATENGYNSNMIFQTFSFQRHEEKKISLTEEELRTLIELDLSNNPRLERVRDLFLFCCETSLRYSDLIDLKPINVKTIEIDKETIHFLDIFAKKTGGIIQSPLSRRAKGILDKYQEEGQIYCFPRISNQKYNSYIKEVGKIAEIDSPVEINKKIGANTIKKTFPKYELISSHTARRTFVTLFVERGGIMEECMIYTGHTDVKELKPYWKKSTINRLKIGRRALRLIEK